MRGQLKARSRAENTVGLESPEDQMLFFFWGTEKRVFDCVEETYKVAT